MSRGKRPPLELYAEVTTPEGRQFRWDPDSPDPRRRPQSIRFRTARWDGFKDAGCELARRLDRDYSDLNLGDDLEFVGYDGQVAYEGFIAAHPGDTSNGHRAAVSAAGWMAHAKDRKIVGEVLVDRLLGGWGAPGLERRAHLAQTGHNHGEIPVGTGPDGLSWPLPQEVSGGGLTELWYTAPPGAEIVRMQYRGTRVGAWTGFEAPTAWTTVADQITSPAATALTLDDTVRDTALTPGRHVLLRAYNPAGPAGPATGELQTYSRVALYGPHDLPLHDVQAGEPQGIVASDAIRYLVAKYAPMLDISGVQDTTTPIPQAVITESWLYDALLKLNAAHLWGLEVWEDRRLHYAGVDLNDYDWQVRLDQPGVQFSPAGHSLDELANAVQVFYTDASTGRREVLLPEEHPELRDDTVGNAWNRLGRTKTIDLPLGFPTLASYALELGRAALADHNYPRGAGTILITGHVQDVAGNWHAPWEMRAGQRIAITDHPNDLPRLIVETDYQHPTRQIKLAVGLPFKRTDAIFDRLSTSLASRGLT